MTTYIVIGESDDAGAYAVGPVYRDATVEAVRGAIEARGDIVRGAVTLTSWGDFRKGGEPR